MLNEVQYFQKRDADGNVIYVAALVLPLLPAPTPPAGFPPPITLPPPPTTSYAQLTAPAGSTGRDYSKNAPGAPLVGSYTFGGESLYKDWQLLETIPANTMASERMVCNNSSSPILVVLDDGSTDGGSTPADCTVMLINAPNTSSPNQAMWRSERFKGRVRVYTPDPYAWVTICEA